MKKLSILFAFLCASMMGWADPVTYCEEVVQSTVDNTSVSIKATVQKSGDKTLLVQFESPLIASMRDGGCFQRWGDGAVWENQVDAVDNFEVGWTHVGNVWSKEFAFSTYPISGTGQIYALFDLTEGTPMVAGFTLNNIDLFASCSSSSSKPSPELSLNATSKTLEIDASAETFQIEPTKEAGSGALSYSSSAEGVATVSSTGLVTAVAAGTATITVSVAENDDFAADSKTLTVEVIDWPNKGWLQNGENAYKLHISPAMGGDGQRIENGNLWVGFPNSELGAMSITPNGGEGAWRTFALSNFPGYRSQFTVVCQGTTYTFTVYRKFDGVNLAKNMPTNAGHSASPSADANDGNKGSRWSSEHGKHYAEYGDMAEDWWYVDLGAMYEISSIKALYQDAYPKDYDLLTSPNGESWVVIDSRNTVPLYGNGDDKYNEYTFDPGKVARYVKIFARDGNNIAWGVSMWEFEVYGQPAEGYDVTAPVLSSAALSGEPTSSEVKIAVSATDNAGDVTVYHVVDNSNGINRNCTVSEGKISISGLTDDTDYSFTVTALDAIGNQSNAIVVNASTAVDPSNPATMAPTPPAREADDVRAVYSDAYTDILAHDFLIGGQWGSTEGTRRVKEGNNYLLYDISANTWIALGVDGGGADAIVAKDGYHGDAKSGLDASGMEKLHIDLWSNVALAHINMYLENTKIATVAHDGTGWNQYDVEYSPENAENIRFMKLEGIDDSGRAKLAIDNIYFWKNPSGVKSVEVSSNNALWGSVSAKVDEEDVSSVALNTEVTFTATPNEGYDFAYWTVNGDRVYTNPYALEITSNTNAVATFEVTRTPYCSVPVTDTEGRTLYLTVSSPSANTYKVLFEGSADNQIGSDDVYLNTQFRLRNVNGESVYHFAYKGDREASDWHVTAADENSYGSAYILFTAEDYRDISVAQQGIVLIRAAGGLSTYDPFPDASLIKWDATCADAAAPDLAAPTATPIGPKSVRLELSATDDIAAMLTYYINYKPTGDEGEGTNVVVAGTSGETTYKNITGLTSSVDYTFSITVSDGTNTSEPQSCSATPTMPTAPVPPARPEMYVRSIYSNAYATMLNADFGKKSFANNDLTWEEMNVNGNHCLFYDLLPHESDAAFAIGGLNPGDIFVAQEAYQGDITEKDNRTTPDVSTMTHLHVDVWSNKATQYAVVQVNGQNVGEIPLLGNGWQQFDLPLETFKASHLADLKDVKYINFVGLRTPNPEEIAIDNVYFYAVPANISFGDDATDNTTTIADNANKFANVTINRNISADDTWYTLCLPFDMDAAKVSEVFGASTIATLVSSEDRGSLIHLNFDYVNAIEAGKPYLIKPGRDFVSGTTISNVTIQNVDPSAEGYKAEATHMHFQGTFDKIMLTGEDKRYVSANNELYSPNPNSGSKIGAFRCFFTIPEGSSALAPGRVAKIVFGEQTATGVDQMGVDAKSNGKLLINGVLYIIRDGKTYNAQGILIQ